MSGEARWAYAKAAAYAVGMILVIIIAGLSLVGCHATSGWDRGAPRLSEGRGGAPVVVVPAEAYGRTLDHLGRRIPQG